MENNLEQTPSNENQNAHCHHHQSKSLGIIIFASAFLMSSFFIGNSIKTLRSAGTITVKGYAEMDIVSDYAAWEGTINLSSTNLSDGYRNINILKDRVEIYLVENGFKKEDIEFGRLSYNENIHYLNNGDTRHEGYIFHQSVYLGSSDVYKIRDISQKITELIGEGIEFYSGEPQYSYTKINDLKLKMIGIASKDAKKRAVEIASSADNSIGSILSASQGVFQITPAGSNEVNDYGMNDMSSINKTIKSVVTIQYSVE
ncbi:MAG: SIMPL domain-containing protein [Ignavibacteria bacterium]|jgi:hypothetical protein|nr:SIMPL domain-containing protein [Ignavibacteria bacterium]